MAEYKMTAVDAVPDGDPRSRWPGLAAALGELPAGSIRRIETETDRDARALNMHLRRFTGLKCQIRTEHGKKILYVTVLGPVERRTRSPHV